MLYHTIYAHWNFGTWIFWNANLSNGFYMVYPTIYWCSNFGTWNFWNANLSNGLYMVYPTIYWCSNFGTWNCWNAILGNGLYMLYHTIYEHSNFGTWNCWNANPSNGLYALYSLHWCSNLEYLNYWDVSLLNIPEIVYVLSMVCLKCCGPLWLQKIITRAGRKTSKIGGSAYYTQKLRNWRFCVHRKKKNSKIGGFA